MRFLPYIGPNFGAPNDLKLPERLLIVGNSHYKNPADYDPAGIFSHPPDDLTERVVQGYICGDWNGPFFRGIHNAIIGHEGDIPPNQRATFYNTIAFYNFVQEIIIGQARANPTPGMYECARLIFPSCLNCVKPTHIVVFGFGTWDKLPGPEGGFCEHEYLARAILKHLPDRYKDNKDHMNRGWIGRYRYADGNALVLKITHPSVPGFSANQWHCVLDWFLTLRP